MEVNLMDISKLNEIREKAMNRIKDAKNSDELMEVRNVFLSKKSELMSMMSTLGQMEAELRKEMGQDV